MLLVAVVVLAAGCFPRNAKHRRYAKIGEGAALVTGIALQFTGKSCMPTRSPGDDCEDGSLDLIGVGLIFVGLAGFAATIMTSPSQSEDFESFGDEGPRVEPERFTWTPPLSFCSALFARNVETAEAALGSYMRQIGATTVNEAMEGLTAWLARQQCVALEEDQSGVATRIAFSVPQQGARYAVDVSAVPFVMLIQQ
jgi:hypothetical protein